VFFRVLLVSFGLFGPGAARAPGGGSQIFALALLISRINIRIP